MDTSERVAQDGVEHEQEKIKINKMQKRKHQEINDIRIFYLVSRYGLFVVSRKPPNSMSKEVNLTSKIRNVNFEERNATSMTSTKERKRERMNGDAVSIFIGAENVFRLQHCHTFARFELP